VINGPCERVLLDQIEQQLARVKLSWFCDRMDPAYERSRHADVLIEHLEAVERGEVKRLAVFMPPRHSKPVSVDALVLMGDGARKRLGDVQVGDRVVTHTGAAQRVEAVHEQGVLATVRLSMRSGRQLVAAPDHPILTANGWEPAGDIFPGMAVATLSRRSLGRAEESDEAFRLAGYIVGDGCVTKTGQFGMAARVTVDDEIERADIQACAEALGFDATIRTTRSHAVDVHLAGGVRGWLKEIGLAGSGSHTKRVPEFVFRGSDEQIAQFVGAYYATDGNAGLRGGRDRTDGRVEIQSVSRDLLRDVQHLLLRLGIMATLAQKIGRYKGEPHLSYRLSMSSRDDVARFSANIPIHHSKAERVQAMNQARQTFDALLRPDIVTAVESWQATECRCLTVADDHTFIADDVVVKNTYHVSERFPAWFLGRNPEQRVILASYGADLAEGSSRKVRNMLLDERWPFAGVAVASDSAAVNKWATSRRGEVIAAGVGGAMTGFGADLLIIDDPVKGRAEADSETYRESTWDWYTEVARTRLMPGGRIVLCQTRWHEDDLAGRILARGGGWTVLNLPAVAGADDPLGRAPGEALWPAWFDTAELEALKTDLTNEQGARGWHALYQQSPTADEGGMFKRAWFSRRWMADALPTMTYTVLVVDSAFKTGVHNDPSSIHLWGTDGIDYYVLDEWHGRWEFPELKRNIVAAAMARKPNLVLIEDTASGQVAIQELRRETGLPIVAHKVTAPKEARAQAVAPICEAGKVVLPSGAPWAPAWVDEHAAFPTGRHDDRVDNTSAALARLAQIGMGISKAASEPVALGWQSGDSHGVPTQPQTPPDPTSVPFNQMSREQRLAALMGSFQSVGTR
jgi:predicted phage terminase large subunit-like protein